ncbi:MAG: hypothetical protein AMXMBFR83_14020 [Phycisphaerae bacterium]
MDAGGLVVRDRNDGRGSRCGRDPGRLGAFQDQGHAGRFDPGPLRSWALSNSGPGRTRSDITHSRPHPRTGGDSGKMALEER